MSKIIKFSPEVSHKKLQILLILLTTLLLIPYKTSAQDTIVVSENLKLIKISPRSYIHISYITLKNGSLYPCNGFVHVDDKEAYIFDTPANDAATNELLEWLQKDQNITIKGVVFNHFHNDCNEGMDIFKKKNIDCIASKKTALLMQKEGYDHPDLIFDKSFEIKLKNTSIINSFFGEAHTKDNIISYFPDEQLIFGGCMIKSLNASKGNLADANTEEWSNTVSKVKEAYPKAKIIIPGHGQYGDRQLLDYTISLFKTEKK